MASRRASEGLRSGMRLVDEEYLRPRLGFSEREDDLGTRNIGGSFRRTIIGLCGEVGKEVIVPVETIFGLSGGLGFSAEDNSPEDTTLAVRCDAGDSLDAVALGVLPLASDVGAEADVGFAKASSARACNGVVVSRSGFEGRIARGTEANGYSLPPFCSNAKSFRAGKREDNSSTAAARVFGEAESRAAKGSPTAGFCVEVTTRLGLGSATLEGLPRRIGVMSGIVVFTSFGDAMLAPTTS